MSPPDPARPASLEPPAPNMNAHNATARRLLEVVRANAQAGSGALDASLRAAVFAAAEAAVLTPANAASVPALPSDVRSYLDQVLTCADADVSVLARAGRSEDFIYELTITAAVAAGSARATAGLAAAARARGNA